VNDFGFIHPKTNVYWPGALRRVLHRKNIMPITVLATVVAIPEFVVVVEAALKNMIPATRAEAGCLSYALFYSEEKIAHSILWKLMPMTLRWLSITSRLILPS
jgi:hypothetical protein